jgi:hypothetical protein
VVWVKRKKAASISIPLFSEDAVGYDVVDHKRYKEMLEQLKVKQADEKLRRYKSNWLRHVTRMNSNRKPRIMLNARPWKKTTWKTVEDTFR